MANFTYATSQVGIGTTTPNSSAILDIDVSNLPAKKGFLLPRVNLTSNSDVATIPSPAIGLMAYNKTAAGSGTDAISANNIVVWVFSQWQKFSNFAEIKTLKIPILFAYSSKTQQTFSASDLTAVNASTTPSNNIVVELSASDISVPNSADILLTGNNIKILTPSFYQISGMISFRANINNTTYGAGAGSTSVASMQVSSDNGFIWTDISSVILPYESYAAGRTQTMTFPVTVKSFAQNDLLRFIISKPTFANNYDTNSGNVVSVTGTDITKSFNLIRIQE